MKTIGKLWWLIIALSGAVLITWIPHNENTRVTKVQWQQKEAGQVEVLFHVENHKMQTFHASILIQAWQKDENSGREHLLAKEEVTVVVGSAERRAMSENLTIPDGAIIHNISVELKEYDPNAKPTQTQKQPLSDVTSAGLPPSPWNVSDHVGHIPAS